MMIEINDIVHIRVNQNIIKSGDQAPRHLIIGFIFLR